MTTASQKLHVAQKLARHGSFTVSIDPRRLGVSVPQRFKPLNHLDLRVKVDGQHRVVLHEYGISGTAYTMAGELIAVSLPWHCTYAIISERDPVSGKFWGADCPEELRLKLAAAGANGERRMVSAVVPSNVVSLAAYRQRKAGCP
jgi:hypothetical protein